MDPVRANVNTTTAMECSKGSKKDKDGNREVEQISISNFYQYPINVGTNSSIRLLADRYTLSQNKPEKLGFLLDTIYFSMRAIDVSANAE